MNIKQLFTAPSECERLKEELEFTKEELAKTRKERMELREKYHHYQDRLRMECDDHDETMRILEVTKEKVNGLEAKIKDLTSEEPFKTYIQRYKSINGQLSKELSKKNRQARLIVSANIELIPKMTVCTESIKQTEEGREMLASYLTLCNAIVGYENLCNELRDNKQKRKEEKSNGEDIHN